MFVASVHSAAMSIRQAGAHQETKVGAFCFSFWGGAQKAISIKIMQDKPPNILNLL